MLDEAKHAAAFGVSFAKPFAAFWKSSICRIQLVSGFHLGKIWATNLSNIFGDASGLIHGLSVRIGKSR
jgi:hypothetical protein